MFDTNKGCFFYQRKVVFRKFQEKDKKTIIAIQDTK